MSTQHEIEAMDLEAAIAGTGTDGSPEHVNTWLMVRGRDKYALASAYHYRVSGHEGEWTAECDEFPKFSATDASSGAALQDVIGMVEEAVELLTAEFGRVPAPVNWESDDSLV